MVQTLPMRGVLRVVPPAQLEASLQAEAEQRVAMSSDAQAQPDMTALAGHIRAQFDMFVRHRNDAAAGWTERLLSALRAFNGVYDAAKLAEIKKFGGTQIYARTIAMKCRGATALLRDVYLAPDRPWGIEAPADPDIPPEVTTAVQQLVQSELQNLQTQTPGAPPPNADAIRDRVTQLMEGARQAEKKNAAKRADIAQDKIEEILDNGGFYKALAEGLVDVPLFPFACVKGPVVRIVPSINWRGSTPVVEQKPRLFWVRVSPFDIWWTPGVSDIEDAAVIERTRLTRADLNDLLDLPGYNQDEVRAVLTENGSGGLPGDWDMADAERAVYEKRENPQTNNSGMITCLEFHGNVQGKMLLEQGMDAKIITDPLRDFMVQAWLIGRHVIKVQITPSPRKRHPYFITSFEKVPGTPVGNGLPDLLADVQEASNAVLRSLVNNLSISSGPQVVVNDDRLAPGELGEELYPWKRWHVVSDPMGDNTTPPVSFFQPVSNSQELLTVYQALNNMADDISAIPKYATGGGASSGAGRTAAGLSMLMGNASKILQTVAANIDRDIMMPSLQGLFDLLMLTDTTGILKGDESIRVMGVNVAMQRETQRSRQLEFLSITANPIDAPILGTKGRAAVLRSVATTIGMDGQTIVPTDDELVQVEQMQQQQQAAEAQGTKPGPTATKDTGPRATVSGGVH